MERNRLLHFLADLEFSFALDILLNELLSLHLDLPVIARPTHLRVEVKLLLCAPVDPHLVPIFEIICQVNLFNIRIIARVAAWLNDFLSHCDLIYLALSARSLNRLFLNRFIFIWDQYIFERIDLHWITWVIQPHCKWQVLFDVYYLSTRK